MAKVLAAVKHPNAVPRSLAGNQFFTELLAATVVGVSVIPSPNRNHLTMAPDPAAPINAVKAEKPIIESEMKPRTPNLLTSQPIGIIAK
jgi:hypothetical protein